jgi:SOS response regulatory protein OraA/RecX
MSEFQLRERLARRAFGSSETDEAVNRLRAAGVVDDRRVAVAAARTEALIRHHGRLRISRALSAMGIARDVAADALDEVFGQVDEAALLEGALARRLHGPGAAVVDRGHFRRLHQYLVRLGFPADEVTALLRRRSRKGAVPEEDA